MHKVNGTISVVFCRILFGLYIRKIKYEISPIYSNSNKIVDVRNNMSGSQCVVKMSKLVSELMNGWLDGRTDGWQAGWLAG